MEGLLQLLDTVTNNELNLFTANPQLSSLITEQYANILQLCLSNIIVFFCFLDLYIDADKKCYKDMDFKR